MKKIDVSDLKVINIEIPVKFEIKDRAWAVKILSVEDRCLTGVKAHYGSLLELETPMEGSFIFFNQEWCDINKPVAGSYLVVDNFTKKQTHDLTSDDYKVMTIEEMNKLYKEVPGSPRIYDKPVKG